MQDAGDEVHFTAGLALPQRVQRPDEPLVLPRRAEEGFLAKVELDGGTNLCSLSVHDGETWREVIEAWEEE